MSALRNHRRIFEFKISGFKFSEIGEKGSKRLICILDGLKKYHHGRAICANVAIFGG